MMDRTYCDQLPVLSFNFRKYDMNLIKSKLAAKLGMAESERAFVVKRSNTYGCLATDEFIFIDQLSSTWM
jgi:hypothetical protein